MIEIIIHTDASVDGKVISVKGAFHSRDVKMVNAFRETTVTAKTDGKENCATFLYVTIATGIMEIAWSLISAGA